ncbi:MAG TPA: DEAD/DEAH box helicase family protein [Anaerolineales bacterium]|nr:DEAD/DEAH box helicase family protein [Anaerolineales bacterium]
MNIELKGFQSTAVDELLKYVRRARRDALDGETQAIVLSSPTGSGKTVTITSLMERIYEGDDSFPPDREAVFLWVSDSPELNTQSYDKILKQSSLFPKSRLVKIEPPFSQERFESGKIYFLNTQKLGKDSLLTKTGDGRDYTIWQTIQNTSASKPASFYVILDEAHRGMSENKREREQANSLVQRLIKGSPEVGLSPVKLIVGMSATPERFSRLIEGTGRTKREYLIDPESVRNSGLLKDEILLAFPDEKQPSDWSLLEVAVKRWRDFNKAWEKYCATQKIENIVKPVLVVQVEDGSKTTLSQTDLNQLVQVVERVTGRLPENAWAHAFQEDNDIEAGGQRIRKIDASKIEDDPLVQIVLFKMSLSTGWDCPRAEVMMSFRKANDHTSIAQLVGRMVRTPLARSIEGQEFLNTVSLYLPHYDRDGLKSILEKLKNPDADTGIAVKATEENEYIALPRAWGKEELFGVLATLPTYKVEKQEKTSHVKRLIKLARQMTMFDEIDKDALPKAKSLIVQALDEELDKLRKRKDFIGNMAANQEIEIREVAVQFGDWVEIPEGKKLKVKATPENIEDLFNQCGRILGEGLHMTFWKAKKDLQNPYRRQLELYGILQEQETFKKLERACKGSLDALYERRRISIEKLPSSRQEEYRRIYFRMQKEPTAEPLVPSTDYPGKKTGTRLEKHLYTDETGAFFENFDASSWEPETLAVELKKPEVIGWLRNLPRKDWSLCIPYDEGGAIKPMYPDFIVFRKVKGKIVVDILDPHTTAFSDAVFKAKGMAAYAELHGESFGRIEIINQIGGKLLRLDLNNEKIRKNVLGVNDVPQLNKLFEAG